MPDSGRPYQEIKVADKSPSTPQSPAFPGEYSASFLIEVHDLDTPEEML